MSIVSGFSQYSTLLLTIYVRNINFKARPNISDAIKIQLGRQISTNRHPRAIVHQRLCNTPQTLTPISDKRRCTGKTGMIETTKAIKHTSVVDRRVPLMPETTPSNTEHIPIQRGVLPSVHVFQTSCGKNASLMVCRDSWCNIVAFHHASRRVHTE